MKLKLGKRRSNKGLSTLLVEESLPISPVDAYSRILEDNPYDIRNSTAYLKALANEVKDHEDVFTKLQSSASIISGVTCGLMVYQVSDDVPCPNYTFSVVITAFLSLGCVLVLSLCSFLTSKLSGIAKADFIDDTRNIKAGAVLAYLLSIPLFLLTLLFKMTCYMDSNETLESLVYICIPIFIVLILVVFYIIYEFDPKLLGFVLLLPTGPLAWYLFPDEFESFGRFKHYSNLEEKFLNDNSNKSIGNGNRGKIISTHLEEE